MTKSRGQFHEVWGTDGTAVQDYEKDNSSQWAAVRAIAEKMGSAEALRNWVRVGG